MSFEEYWNNDHLLRCNDPIKYDLWLDKYKDIIDKCKTPIVDLGCGIGNDTMYLLEQNKQVIACDYSYQAIVSIKQHFPEVNTLLFNMEEGLPFSSGSVEVIVADLSLHYFNNKKTIEIIEEIKRVLKPHGYLLARVNSIDDKAFGANEGKKIEKNYYFTQGYNKRFFDDEDIEYYFSRIGKLEYQKATMKRYAFKKYLYEVKVEKD